MNLTSSLPFKEALEQLAQKNLLPTSLDTAGIRSTLDASARRQSFCSAQTTIEDIISGYKDRIESLINPLRVKRADRITADNPEGFVNEGIDQATFRLEMKKLIASTGYQPDPEKRGGLQDLSSDARINLVIKTNKELVQGAGHFIQSNDSDVIDAFPCWELVRFEARKTQRDWNSRFLIAARAAGDTDAIRVLSETGRMVARKDSDVWSELGSSENFSDALDNPYPPFAFNSGMWTQDVSYDDAVALGIPVKNVGAQKIEFGEIFNQETV